MANKFVFCYLSYEAPKSSRIFIVEIFWIITKHSYKFEDDQASRLFLLSALTWEIVRIKIMAQNLLGAMKGN